MPLLFDDFNDAIRHFGIQKITAISKTDSQDFSQWNPRDQNAGIHRVPLGAWRLGLSVRVWLKKRNFRWLSGSGKLIWIVSSYGIYKKEVRQKKHKAGRNVEKWYRSPTKQTLDYNYKQSKPQKCVRNPGKRTCEDKQNLIKSCKRSGIFKYFCVFGFPWDGSGGVPQV